MSKLLCGLTSLPLAQPSSITPDAGPSCLKPHVSAHSPKRFPGGRAGRMKEASLHPPDWPHVACKGVYCHHMSDPCAGRYCCPQAQHYLSWLRMCMKLKGRTPKEQPSVGPWTGDPPCSACTELPNATHTPVASRVALLSLLAAGCSHVALLWS